MQIHNCRPVAHTGSGRFRDVAVFDAEVADGFRVLGLKLALSPDGKKFIFAPRLAGQRTAQLTGEYAKRLGEAAWQALEAMSQDGR